MPETFDLKNKDAIAELQSTVKDIAQKYPIFISFMEYYCGFTAALNTSNPYEISYSGGKRDVFLMLKTLMRNDVLPEQLASYYERNL